MAGKTPRVFACANCGASIPLRAIGLTVTVACPTCGAVIDATSENYRIVSTIAKKTTIKPLIPLGTRGTLAGKTWEVIGFMQRTDGSGRYPWKEYLLFNPYYGFRWLTEADGHWNFVRMIKEMPEVGTANMATYDWQNFRLFHRGKAKVAYVLGEFYWRVKVGETVDVEDYVVPPRILSAEKSAQEITWSVGEYLAPEAVKQAFGIKRAMPLQKGIAPNQEAPLKRIRPKINRLAWIFLGIVCLLQLSSCVASPNRELFRASYPVSPNAAQMRVSPPFTVPSRMTNLAIRIDAPVQDSWVIMDGELVNDSTGEIREFSKEVEYYSGYDSDGYWSEGSQSGTVYLAAVPRGTYHLNFQVSGPAGAQPISYALEVRRGVPRWPNFFLAIALLGIWPIWLWWKDRSFEIARWSESDYSPYPTGDDDED